MIVSASRNPHANIPEVRQKLTYRAEMNSNSVFGTASRVPTIPEILAAYGVAEEYMPQALLHKLQCIETNTNVNAVDEIMRRAHEVYKKEVEVRKNEQIRKYCESTGEKVESLSNLTVRKLTNRATAGAGKTRYQYLLKSLEQCARALSDEESEIARFFYQVLKQNYYHVVSGRAGMINAPDDMGNTVSEEVLENPYHFEQQLKWYRIVLLVVSLALLVTLPLAFRCLSCSQGIF